MKKPVPGHTYWLNGHQLRFKKRICGCQGCIYENNLILCPGVNTREGKILDCVEHEVILVKFK